MRSIIKRPQRTITTPDLSERIVSFLDENKATDIVTMDLRDKAFLTDYMIIANGISYRHVGALAEKLQEELHKLGIRPVFMEGKNECNWVLVDAGDIIVHIFYPEAREKYQLESMWSVDGV